jgi:hypothetical protein
VLILIVDWVHSIPRKVVVMTMKEIASLGFPYNMIGDLGERNEDAQVFAKEHKPLTEDQ